MLVNGMVRIIKINVERITENSGSFLKRDSMLLKIAARLCSVAGANGKRLFYFRIVKPFNARLENSWLAFSSLAEAPVSVSST